MANFTALYFRSKDCNQSPPGSYKFRGQLLSIKRPLTKILSGLWISPSTEYSEDHDDQTKKEISVGLQIRHFKRDNEFYYTFISDVEWEIWQYFEHWISWE
jgi:hypothetical protein